MNKKTALSWLAQNKKRIYYEFGLDDWQIHLRLVNFPALDDSDSDNDTYASVEGLDYVYKIAVIVMHYKLFENEKELETTLRHECYHLLMAPLEMFYQSLRDQDILDGDESFINDYRIKCEEIIVTSLEKHRSRIK